MWWTERSRPLHSLTGAILAVCSIVVARPAAGQAFIPAAGDGTVSASYQLVRTEGQIDNYGQELSRDPSSDFTQAHSLVWYFEYGLSNRFAVHASLPFMATRYQGPNPHPIGIKGQPSNADDGRYHGSFQDLYVGTRFRFIESPRFALTPFAEVIVPSHHYESLAQSAVGRDLRALVVGAAIGGFADDVLPGLHFQTRISHAFVQEVADLRTNRTAVDSAVGYFVTPRLAVQFIQVLQITHDGLDFNAGAPPAIHSGATYVRELHGVNHDRLIRTNILNLGGGVTFALTGTIGVFGTATTMAWGENTTRPRSMTVGVNWNFQTRRASSVSPNQNARVRLPSL